jgi:hypothetical protein
MQHEDYVHAAIIPPPESGDYEKDVKYTRIVIDSKDRDSGLFPDPNNYEVRFDDDIDDVLSVQLLSIDVPMSTYMINKHFDQLTVITNNTPQQVALNHGDYDATSLATMLSSSLGTSDFQVDYDPIKDNYRFKSKALFSLAFPETNSLHQLLGFYKKQYDALVDTAVPVGEYRYYIKSEFRKNFKYNNYLVLNIDQFDVNKSNGDTLHRTFAVIVDNYCNLNLADTPKIIKNFTPPIPRLSKVKISFSDRYGNPYDFQNMDHRIELLFTSHKQKRKYQNIFLNR